jgi:23S rRNA (pseudouridine1915-N3)-methyltransferase
VRLVVVAVGRVRGALEPAVADYEARARRYWKLDVLEVEAGASGKNPGPERVRAAEAGRILPKVPAELELYALTREGRTLSSRALAKRLSGLALDSSPGAVFVLGGAFGLDHRVLRRSTDQLSLSAMTLPHELARLVLAEQLYRAGTIVRGEPYHKGA